MTAELVLTDRMELRVLSSATWDDIHIHLEGDPTTASPAQLADLKEQFGALVDVLARPMCPTRFTAFRGEEGSE